MDEYIRPYILQIPTVLKTADLWVPPQILDDKPNTSNDVHYWCFIRLIESNDS
ncbi:hypothetical protein GPSY_4369 [Paraglaciecola psychrophila 170]|nr:hypothetical protein GPSY_4369 [Paraglaciecola psychrophila 170]